jgi:FkbM family methyltransferase
MNEFVYKNDFRVQYRPDTTDVKVIEEVLKRGAYERKKINFGIEPMDVWLDCGANIGTFSLLCLSKKAKVIAFEPEPENFSILDKNIRLNDFQKNAKIFPYGIFLENKSLPLYLCKGNYNKYRHTLFPKRGRSAIYIRVKSISEVLQKYPINCIKMDIEGAEIEILEHLKPSDYQKINKMVFEYSFDIDKSIPRFMKIINHLKTIFILVHYDKVNPNESEYNYFPASTLVFCKK